MAKIGVIGGTFDPIHIGHIRLAECARYEADLHKILFVPNHVPWMKKDREITDEIHRIEMVKAAIADEPLYELSLVDIEAGGDSYTYRTLELLKERYPEDVFYFILGADSLLTIENWVHPEKIFRDAVILAAVRDECDIDRLSMQKERLMKQYDADIRLLHMQGVDISSTYIREHFYDDVTVFLMLPQKTAEYIKDHQLYRR